MPRYFTRPHAYVDRESDEIWWRNDNNNPTATIHEPEESQRFTGLYDAEGTPLYREIRRTIGFLADHTKG